MKNWSILLLLLNLGFFPGCNKVREIPEPDNFSSVQLSEKQVAARGGTVEIDLMKMFGIKEQVSISFQPPRQGSISANSSGTAFTYKARPGFTGFDTLNYEICRLPDCKNGTLRIEVTENPEPHCYPVYGPDSVLTFVIQARVGATQYRIPRFPGDVYCPLNHQRIDFWSSFWFEPVLENDSITLIPKDMPIRDNIEGTLTYSNGDTSRQPVVYKARTYNIIIDTSKTYCQNLFRVDDWGNPLLLGREFTVSPKIFSNRGLIKNCKNDIHPTDWGIVTSVHMVKSVNHDAGGIVIMRKWVPEANSQCETFIKYYFKNLSRTVCDTGKISVIF